MADIHFIQFDDAGALACVMPASEEVVEVFLNGGHCTKAVFWYDGPEDWDFADTDNPENLIEADSILDQVVAWRRIQPSKNTERLELTHG